MHFDNELFTINLMYCALLFNLCSLTNLLFDSYVRELRRIPINHEVLHLLFKIQSILVILQRSQIKYVINL